MQQSVRWTMADIVMWVISLGFLVALGITTADAAPPKAAGGAAATWREECGSCHLAFPARLLPGQSWNVLLAGLDHHFGVDASLAPGPLSEVRDYLNSRSEPGDGSARPQSPPRITTSAWFRREHAEVAPPIWRRQAIRSAANCGACHAGAAQGDFDEDSVSIPR